MIMVSLNKLPKLVIIVTIFIGIVSGMVTYYALNKSINIKRQVNPDNGSKNIGLLVGKMEGGKIENSYAYGTITVQASEYDTNVGIIGSVSGDSEIKNVSGNVNVNHINKSVTILERYPIISSLVIGITSSLIASFVFNKLEPQVPGT